ncbi:DNA topoisomerase family protein [Arsukibacterium sp.]|uniref:DNA topoisomerase family protein n=1 Tax=Arsukibacterium sp. TaxID=1977258 RepID=UPI002FDB4AB9
MSDHSPLFKLPQHAEPCPLCHNPLMIKSGKNGPFLSCSAYPDCHYIKALHQHDNTVVKLLPDQACPLCQSELAVKNGRYGMFIGCTNYPACHFVVHEQDDEPAAERIACPKCRAGHLTERVNKFGKHFWGCDQYPKCKFLLNDTPVRGSCICCGFTLLLQKKLGVYCADKKCGEKQPAD